MIDVWQYYEYALDPEYAWILNMLELHMALNKLLHNRYLTGFWTCLQFWICHSSKYAGITQGSWKNAAP